MKLQVCKIQGETLERLAFQKKAYRIFWKKLGSFCVWLKWYEIGAVGSTLFWGSKEETTDLSYITFVTIMCDNDELSWTMTWVGCLLTDKCYKMNKN